MLENQTLLLSDPLYFKELCFPHIKFYDRQVDIIRSVVENDTTIVPAGNALGKDFIAAFICLWFFCSRSPCRVVTHSVDQPQLKGVLWGEIRRFVDTSRVKLPIEVGDLFIRQVRADGSYEPLSYLIGRVTRKGEGLLGHHVARTRDGIPRTLFLADEASGIDDEAWEKVDTWAHRKLAIGNPYPCQNFFYKEVKEGDVRAQNNGHHFRKIIHIRASDSPNVRLAEQQIRAGRVPTNEILIPGVKDYPTYLKHRQTWDKVRQCIGLDGEFYEGAETLLFPPDWLNRAEQIADSLPVRRPGKAMGIDAAEGNDNTCWVVVDERGMIHMRSIKTQDTSDITGITIALGREYQIPPERWIFDRGGGGKQHVDRLRTQGYNAQSVGFGEAVVDPEAWKKANVYVPKAERREQMEDKYIYKNRRAEMYGTLRLALNPTVLSKGFGLPAALITQKRVDGGPSLRTQLAMLPLLYDSEGRMYLPPKRKKDKDDKRQTLIDILGCSPDEADALVLAVYGLTYKPAPKVGSMV